MGETLDGMTSLLKLWAQIFYVSFYPFAIVFMTLYLNLGLLSWLVITVFLTPPALAWYVIVKRRIESYLRLLLGSAREWNIEKSVTDYMELLDSSGKDRKT